MSSSSRYGPAPYVTEHRQVLPPRYVIGRMHVATCWRLSVQQQLNERISYKRNGSCRYGEERNEAHQLRRRSDRLIFWMSVYFGYKPNSENTVLSTGWQEAEENCVMRIFITCTNVLCVSLLSDGRYQYDNPTGSNTPEHVHFNSW
jgi:hypothetical protein